MPNVAVVEADNVGHQDHRKDDVFGSQLAKRNDARVMAAANENQQCVRQRETVDDCEHALGRAGHGLAILLGGADATSGLTL